MKQDERRGYLIKELLRENSYKKEIPNEIEEQKKLLRALFNIRMPRKISDEFLKTQDEYLQEEIKNKRITELKDLEEIEKNIYLWLGDITTLKVDAIVNAANNKLLGCFQPNHACIDNAIHTFSGIQLRLECNELMKNQGHYEKTGVAKITKAYNPPNKYVIHTVGLIVYGNLREEHCELLKSCYESCLTLAEEKNLESIAFCCISTGEFRFPNDIAAQIAVSSVRKFLEKRKAEGKKKIKVIFNVFKEKDREIYRKLLG